MAKPKNDFALGLWVLVVIVLFIGVLLFIGGQNLGRRYQAYAVRFPVTYALPDEIKAGAAVHCGAARVGKVTDVSLRRGEGADEPSTDSPATTEDATADPSSSDDDAKS